VPARLAVGFGPKELSPTPARPSLLAIHPADLSEGPCGSPAPRRHPGARRHGYSIVTSGIRPLRTNVKVVRLGLGLKQCSCEFTSSAADVYGGASPGVRFGFPQDFVGDGGCVALAKEKKSQ
jgi:hypothetical protein